LQTEKRTWEIGESKRVNATCSFLSNQEDEPIKAILLPGTRRSHIHHILQPSPSLHHLTLGQPFEDIQLLPGKNQQLFHAPYISRLMASPKVKYVNNFLSIMETNPQVF
jgi:hypothetical protein